MQETFVIDLGLLARLEVELILIYLLLGDFVLVGGVGAMRLSVVARVGLYLLELLDGEQWDCAIVLLATGNTHLWIRLSWV